MTERDFIYWLHGFFDLATTYPVEFSIMDAQKDLIRNHITLVRATPGTHSVVASVEGLLTLDDPTEALQAVLKAQIVQVIDPEADARWDSVSKIQEEIQRKLQENPIPLIPGMTCPGSPQLC